MRFTNLNMAKRFKDEGDYPYPLGCEMCNWIGTDDELYKQKCPKCGSKAIYERVDEFGNLLKQKNKKGCSDEKRKFNRKRRY